MKKFSVSAFVCLICVMVLLNTAESRPPPQCLRCKCLPKQIYSSPPIPRHRIVSVNVIPAGPHCKNDEIIVTMKKRQMCLDPKADWVIALVKSRKTTTQSPKSTSSTKVMDSIPTESKK